ncbi:MAG: hypothetical protein JWP66_1679 [Naasia sp.]|nr:hypothetical protein [Naasia sp.]
MTIPAAACGDPAGDSGTVQLRYTLSGGEAASCTVAPSDPFDMVAR